MVSIVEVKIFGLLPSSWPDFDSNTHFFRKILKTMLEVPKKLASLVKRKLRSREAF